jgi:predicted NAD/FAD-binding protein
MEAASTSAISAVPDSPRRIAVIGGGVAGLAAAWQLSKVDHLAVELWEAEDRLGGHAWTVPVFGGTEDRTTLVDIGFMVYNSLNYPNLMAWFRCLNVSSERSDMSLAVSLTKQSSKKKTASVVVEWSSSDYSWRRLFRTLIRFVSSIGPLNTMRLILDMLRFNNTVTTDLLSLSVDDPRRFVSIEQYLRNRHYSSAFATFYLYPMMAALWSASLQDVCQFPAVQVVSFLQNHQMLQLLQRPVWQTVAQRSRTYVQQVEQELMATSHHPNSHRTVHTGARVHSIREPEPGRYQLVLEDNVRGGLEVVEGRHFDHVIFACHTDQARRILERSTFREGADGNQDLLDTLQDVEYADNAIYVHSDASLMPRDPEAWASWNCIGSADKIVGGSQMVQGGIESLHLNTVGNDPFEELEGINGRFKAVYVT